MISDEAKEGLIPIYNDSCNISSYYVFIIMFSYLNLLISIMMVIVFD